MKKIIIVYKDYEFKKFAAAMMAAIIMTFAMANDVWAQCPPDDGDPDATQWLSKSGQRSLNADCDILFKYCYRLISHANYNQPITDIYIYDLAIVRKDGTSAPCMTKEELLARYDEILGMCVDEIVFILQPWERDHTVHIEFDHCDNESPLFFRLGKASCITEPYLQAMFCYTNESGATWYSNWGTILNDTENITTRPPLGGFYNTSWMLVTTPCSSWSGAWDCMILYTYCWTERFGNKTWHREESFMGGIPEMCPSTTEVTALPGNTIPITVPEIIHVRKTVNCYSNCYSNQK